MALEEASMNFDPEELRPFLERLRTKLSILQPCDIERLAREIAVVPVQRVGRWRFDVTYRQRSVPLEVRAAMDEVDAPDVYFFTDSELADQIQGEMHTFANQRGSTPLPPVVVPSLLWSLLVT
jgi:hypothetical protein